MRYFDPDMQRGLIPIIVMQLSGDDWLPGPVTKEQLAREYRRFTLARNEAATRKRCALA
jgi:hypothetical protein